MTPSREKSDVAIGNNVDRGEAQGGESNSPGSTTRVTEDSCVDRGFDSKEIYLYDITVVNGGGQSLHPKEVKAQPGK